jgi:hypothetical protein
MRYLGLEIGHLMAFVWARKRGEGEGIMGLYILKNYSSRGVTVYNGVMCKE